MKASRLYLRQVEGRCSEVEGKQQAHKSSDDADGTIRQLPYVIVMGLDTV